MYHTVCGLNVSHRVWFKCIAPYVVQMYHVVHSMWFKCITPCVVLMYHTVCGLNLSRRMWFKNMSSYVDEIYHFIRGSDVSHSMYHSFYFSQIYHSNELKMYHGTCVSNVSRHICFKCITLCVAQPYHALGETTSSLTSNVYYFATMIEMVFECNQQ